MLEFRIRTLQPYPPFWILGTFRYLLDESLQINDDFGNVMLTSEHPNIVLSCQLGEVQLSFRFDSGGGQIASGAWCEISLRPHFSERYRPSQFGELLREIEEFLLESEIEHWQFEDPFSGDWAAAAPMRRSPSPALIA